MKVLMVGSGSVESMELLWETAASSQLLIAVDGGARYFRKAGITPHLLLGDFDSIEPNLLKTYEEHGVEIVKHPSHKDYTDMELALDCAVERGATRIVLMGAAGTRLDHTLSNLQLLHKLLDVGVEGILLNENNLVFLISQPIELQRKEGYRMSLLPATPVVGGITLEGFAYPLNNFTMKMGTGIGISNEFIAEKASIKIKSGRLYVILARD